MLSKEDGCWESTKPLTLHIICRVMLLVPTLIHLKHSSVYSYQASKFTNSYTTAIKRVHIMKLHIIMSINIKITVAYMKTIVKTIMNY